MINTRFWSDGWVINLDPLERYLFLYLLTNEHTNICGIYELPIRIIARESGIEDEMIEKMLRKMTDKIAFIDGWVYIKNFAKHQLYNESVKIGIEKARKEIPERILAKIIEIEQSGVSLGTPRGVFTSVSVSELESKYKGTRFTPPSLIAVSEYITRMNYGLDPQEFMDANEARGWMVGKAKMKDWEAVVRTFERNRLKWNKERPKDINERRILWT